MVEVLDRMTQLEQVHKALGDQTSKIESSLAELKKAFTAKIDRLKEAALSMGRIEFLISRAGTELQEYDKVTNDFFSIFQTSYSNNRLPKVVSPSVFVIERVDRLARDVDDLLDKVKEAEIAT